MSAYTPQATTEDDICFECGKPWSECINNPAVLAEQEQRDADQRAWEWGAGRTFYEGTEIEPADY